MTCSRHDCLARSTSARTSRSTQRRLQCWQQRHSIDLFTFATNTRPADDANHCKLGQSTVLADTTPIGPSGVVVSVLGSQSLSPLSETITNRLAKAARSLGSTAPETALVAAIRHIFTKISLVFCRNSIPFLCPNERFSWEKNTTDRHARPRIH